MNIEKFEQFLKSPDVKSRVVRSGLWVVSVAGTGAFGFSVRRTQRFWLLNDGNVYGYWDLFFKPPECISKEILDEIQLPCPASVEFN